MTEVISPKEPVMISLSENMESKGVLGNQAQDFSDEEVNKNDNLESSDDDGSIGIVVKKSGNRNKTFSDSDSDVNKENTDENLKSQPINNDSSDSDDYTNIIKQKSKKSRIRNIKSDHSASDSEEPAERQLNVVGKRVNRITEKRNKLREKFQNLLDAKDKEEEEVSNKYNKSKNSRAGVSTSSEDEEITSINEIKEKIKQHTNNLKMAICDPDTSEDESSHPRQVEKPKKQQKRMKLTSPKPQRMSAKQAMENMQKIKSESNRMLREKDVSLPYHRPKVLKLQDIMSRRKPAVSSDGKVLPIKMNEEQLRQYALQLEQRQKEMIELCKSDTEEEESETAEDNKQSEDMPLALSPKTTEFNNKDCESETLSESNISVSCSINKEINSDNNYETEKLNSNKLGEESTKVINTTNHDTEVTESNQIVINGICADTEYLQDKSEDLSAEMELVYNDSVEENNEANIVLNELNINTNEITENSDQNKAEEVEPSTIIAEVSNNTPQLQNSENETSSENFTEKDSQLISLQYDTEKDYSEALGTEKMEISSDNNKNLDEKTLDLEQVESNEFPDDDNELEDINMEDIDTIIENAEILRDGVSVNKINSPALVKDTVSLTSKPKLIGAPGMVIDLDGSDAVFPKKATGVELLKERFTYFAKLKTPEEIEREREKRQKPGTQHIKLKQELEEKIAEQRSLEWAKRLEAEKQQQEELDAIRGDSSDVEDDIDKIEAKLEENEVETKVSSSESEAEEEIEDDVLIEDKPRKKNPLVADEAEESDVDEAAEENVEEDDENEADIDREDDGDCEANDESDGDSSDDEESSESEDEQATKPKKGRILKAFEDSDDEDTVNLNKDSSIVEKQELSNKNTTDDITEQNDNTDIQMLKKSSDVTVSDISEKVDATEVTKLCKSDSISESQDDDLQLAQVPQNNSEELFASQESMLNKPISKISNKNTVVGDNSDVDLGSQTFSIMNSSKPLKDGLEIDLATQEKMSVISETQPFDDNLDAVVGMCSGSFSQNFIEIKPPSTQSQNLESQSQAIGDDILEMCTGKFYDNEFVSSQNDENAADTAVAITQEYIPDTKKADPKIDETAKKEGDILKSVLEELNESELETSKPMKYFFDNKGQNRENINNTQLKKKFVIDSDDDINDDLVPTDIKKKKKLKKRKLEKRALQISDDEDDEYSEQECDDLMSENEDVQNDDVERLVEYDSEENEIEVKQQPKKKRRAADFFEQEAELTSEDEWAGSGDEDEAGLDRMEREAGDDDTFHQGQLQAELGQIHMRDVLDQDKREVRLIQELLFEDGDLGGGGRQRKFRWRNADGEEVTGTIPDELADTQEEEFESEEQWRKQRHEREMFLRQLKSEGESEKDLNTSVNRTTIIKANLLSRTMSSVLEEANTKETETVQLPVVPEKKTTKDIPSPKKPFSVFQQNYHGSLLTRGRGALARLAALATPLAVDDDAPKMGLVGPSSKRNFVFAAIAPEDKEPKVTKRKAETNVGTPRLVKKMRTEDKKQPKSSLLDHLKA